MCPSLAISVEWGGGADTVAIVGVIGGSDACAFSPVNVVVGTPADSLHSPSSSSLSALLPACMATM